MCTHSATEDSRAVPKTLIASVKHSPAAFIIIIREFVEGINVTLAIQ